jgi:hypothetical protein
MTQRDQVGSSPLTFVLTLKTNFDLLGEGGGNSRSKPFTDSVVIRKPTSATSPEAKRKGDSLLDMLKQFGRVSGSIFVAAKTKVPGQPDGPIEVIESLRFDKGSSAPTK